MHYTREGWAIFFALIGVPVALSTLWYVSRPEYAYVCTQRRCLGPPFHHTCWCSYGYYKEVAPALAQGLMESLVRPPMRVLLKAIAWMDSQIEKIESYAQ